MLTNYCYQTDIRFQSLNCPVPSPLLCGLDIGSSGIKIGGGIVRVHLRFLKKDPDLCKWRHSVSGKMLSFYLNSILSAELHNSCLLYTSRCV